MRRHELNLIPAEVLAAYARRRRLWSWVRWGTPLLLLLTISRLAIDGRLERREDDLALQRIRQETVELRRTAIAALNEEKAVIEADLARLMAMSPEGSVLEVLCVLEEAMPPMLYLRSLSIEPPAIRRDGGREREDPAGPPAEFSFHLEGRAPSTELLGSFLFSMSNHAQVSNTQLKYSRRSSSGDQAGVEFGVDSRFHLTPPPETDR